MRRGIRLPLVAIVLVLAGCAAPRTAVVPAPSSAGTAPATVARVSARERAGCPATAARTPAGAVRAGIVDVDGDGRRDVEWALAEQGGALRFGVTTASGATIAGVQGFAGGGDRTVVIGRLANGVAVAVTSEGRDSPVLTLTGCTLRPLRGADPLPGSTTASPFTLYSASDGGAGGCVDGRLALLHAVERGKGREDVVARWIRVSADGRHATLTRSTATIAHDVPAERASRFRGISCGSSPVLRPVA